MQSKMQKKENYDQVEKLRGERVSERKKKTIQSFEPDSNQRPMDNHHTTVHRSTN